MKETPTKATIAVSDLKIEGVYFNTKDELCKILGVDNEKRQVKVLNMSEQMTVYLDFKRCLMHRQVR